MKKTVKKIKYAELPEDEKIIGEGVDKKFLNPDIAKEARKILKTKPKAKAKAKAPTKKKT